MERIVPANLEGDELWRRNGEYVNAESYDSAIAHILNLETALRDCTVFVVVHVDRWTRDNGGVMHKTHRELLDRVGRLTGQPDLLQRLEPKI